MIMTQYIDKSALIAEINKRIIDAPISHIGNQRVWAYNDVKGILDTLETTEDEHWQEVRERAAIAAMQGVMNFFGSIDYNKKTIAELAVSQADALIEQLKKNEL